METRKIIGTIVGVLAFIALVAGLTYAWFTWSSGDTILNGTTDCFTINYTGGTAITSLIPTSTYNGDGSGKTQVTIGISDECTVEGTAKILFTVNDTTNMPLGEKTPINYAVEYVDPDTSENKLIEGKISNKGQMVLAENLKLTSDPITYTVYVWANTADVTNEHSGVDENENPIQFSGYIHASAQQTPDNQ